MWIRVWASNASFRFCRGVDSNYRTDLFTGSLDVLRSLTGHSEEQMNADFTPYRVVCDHARAAAFLIADGVVPGNAGRNYITRMIIRRGARFGSRGREHVEPGRVGAGTERTAGDEQDEAGDERGPRHRPFSGT